MEHPSNPGRHAVLGAPVPHPADETVFLNMHDAGMGVTLKKR